MATEDTPKKKRGDGIIRAPRASDPPGKCSRWRVAIYVRTAQGKRKQEWHQFTTKEEARAFKAAATAAKKRGSYIARMDQKTVTEVAAMFMREREARQRRTATLIGYRDDLGLDANHAPRADMDPHRHLLAKFGAREIVAVRRADFAAWFAEMLAAGRPTSRVNSMLRTCKALLNFALEQEWVERNPLARFRHFADNGKGRKVRRDAFTEPQALALIDKAPEHVRPFVAFALMTGCRPGEIYALRACDLDLDSGTATIARNYDFRGHKFTEPKTRAGRRVVPLSPWLVAELREHLRRTGAQGEALVFTNGAGRVLDPGYVRRNWWQPLCKAAGVPAVDLYSCRVTFATLARSSGESAFNVARAMGHARSTLVDDVYARANAKGLESVATAVAGRILGDAAGAPTPPTTPPKGRGRGALRVLDGGRAADISRILGDCGDGIEKTSASR